MAERRKSERVDTQYVACISYGKDSLAQLEVIRRHDLSLTDIVTADIMATPDIPAYLPELVEFRGRMDREIEARYGIPVTHVRAGVTFQDLFYRQLGKRSKYSGIWGWPPIFGHWCMTELKQRPIQEYFKGRDCVQWLGIAADEAKRHGQLNERKRSALAEHGVTEAQAMKICEGLGWVSPAYLHSGRDGCWFCPCQGTGQLRRLYNEYPEYWRMLLDWDKDANQSFKIGRTLAEYSERFRLETEGLLDPESNNFRWAQLEGELQYRLF